MKIEQTKVSVRELVEYSLRSGNIDFEYQSRVSRAREGVVLHQRLQKKREAQAALEGGSYVREVPFARDFEEGGLTVTVGGRADGIRINGGIVLIEEIKTTERPLEDITGSALHIAQAKCYAYFYMLESGIKHISVMLTYYSALTFDTKEFIYEYEHDELSSFFNDILRTYVKWVKFLINCKKARNNSISLLSFPYENYRELQREMCVAVYRAIERKRPVFISAPTGIGKTISALFPAVKSIEKKAVDKVFYLTAKTMTRQSALDAAALMEKKGLRAKTLVITAKDKICFKEEAACSPESCPYADGHFNRVNSSLYDILENETIITREVLRKYAKKHKVCPYEFCLDIALFADIVICDYNYAFDPRVYLRRFFAETSEDYVFLIDEAHNLIDRAREMYSADISGAVLKRLARKLRKNARSLKRIINEITEELSELCGKIDPNDFGLVFESPPKRVINLAREYGAEADKWLAENRGSKPAYYDDIKELYFEFNHFISISELFDEKFVCFCERAGGERLRLFCADPSGQLEIMLKNSLSAAFFSATLTPLDYFKRLLGASESDYAVAYPSPFPKRNLSVFAVTGISAKYKDRALYYEDVADCIYASANAKPGNYLAFFPSYSYLDSVYGLFCAKFPDISTFRQTKDMTEIEKESFLEKFTEQEERVFIAFAVLGGMFSEGIDLPGIRLIGAVIVSVGLPQLSFERLLISNYFAGTEGKGFEYSYMFPGMNKVLQAGGRVIRTASDKGIIVLIDERFTLYEYCKLFPESWSGFITVRGKDALRTAAENFWKGSGRKQL